MTVSETYRKNRREYLCAGQHREPIISQRFAMRFTNSGGLGCPVPEEDRMDRKIQTKRPLDFSKGLDL